MVCFLINMSLKLQFLGDAAEFFGSHNYVCESGSSFWTMAPSGLCVTIE
jgi:hypothetical protein